MKVTVLPSGSVEIEFHNGDHRSALALIRSLQGVREAVHVPVSGEEVLLDPAVLTAAQRSVYNVLAGHPTGCHISAVAEEMGMDKGIVNARLVSLTNRGFAERLRAGTYRLAGEDVSLVE